MICNIGARFAYRVVIRENPMKRESFGLRQGCGEASHFVPQKPPRFRNTDADVARIMLSNKMGEELGIHLLMNVLLPSG